mmetsp:Transcript_29951/g.56642  ORF Transcript_29951/g.56642 Transcript_29951/m.56642 type:complete len:251 (+) Transcript_29951:2199-2951(+)
MMTNIKRNYNIHHPQQILKGLILLGITPGDDPSIVLLPDLAGERAYEFVSPCAEVAFGGGGGVSEGGEEFEVGGSLEFELEGFSLLMLPQSHGQHRQNIPQPRPQKQQLLIPLQIPHNTPIILLQHIKLRSQKFQRLGNARHTASGTPQLVHNDIERLRSDGCRDGRFRRFVNEGGDARFETFLEFAIFFGHGIFVIDNVVGFVVLFFGRLVFFVFSIVGFFGFGFGHEFYRFIVVFGRHDSRGGGVYGV